jgi:hypothetical protein
MKQKGSRQRKEKRKRKKCKEVSSKYIPRLEYQHTCYFVPVLRHLDTCTLQILFISLVIRLSDSSED